MISRTHRSLRAGLHVAGLGMTLLAASAAPASPVQARELSAEQAPGLPIGARAPEFTLQDQDGNPVSLNETLKRGPVALVFYRSADW